MFIWTLRLLDRIGPVGKFGEKLLTNLTLAETSKVCSTGFLISQFLQVPGCQKPCPYLGRLQHTFVCCVYLDDWIY